MNTIEIILAAAALIFILPFVVLFLIAQMTNRCQHKNKIYRKIYEAETYSEEAVFCRDCQKQLTSYEVLTFPKK